MGAYIAAAAVHRAERHIVDRLLTERATSPDHAVSLSDLPFVQGRRLQRLLNARVVREAPGGYWLDEAMYAGYRSDRRALALVMLAIVTTTALGMFLVGWMR